MKEYPLTKDYDGQNILGLVRVDDPAVLPPHIDWALQARFQVKQTVEGKPALTRGVAVEFTILEDRNLVAYKRPPDLAALRTAREILARIGGEEGKGELGKPAPDVYFLRRWAVRLVDALEDVVGTEAWNKAWPGPPPPAGLCEFCYGRGDRELATVKPPRCPDCDRELCEACMESHMRACIDEHEKGAGSG